MTAVTYKTVDGRGILADVHVPTAPNGAALLCIHGEADTDVPFEQSFVMRAELARHGVVHELISEPEWDHAFDIESLSDPKVRSAVERVVEFVTLHAGAERTEPS